MQRAGLLAVAILVACSSPEAKLEKSIDSAATAMAASAMTGEKFVANSVPRAFVKNSLESASKELDKASKDLDLTDAKNAVAEMRNALDANDHARMLAQARRLESLAKKLRESSQ